MEVLRAKTAGFCMGVSLALQKLDSALDATRREGASARICTLGPIIHNPQVLAAYEARGVFSASDDTPLGPQDTVIIRAHGITRQAEARLRASGAQVVDATCPKVKKAQLAIARATEGGAALLLFGESEHPEVRGLISYAGGAAHVFGSLDELAAIRLDASKAHVLASQTTQDRQTFTSVQESLCARLPDLTVLSTICDATRQRQEEARQIASQVDIMVVVGGKQSGNTRRLADVAALSGIATFHVESVDELDDKNFRQKKRAGLTAGASTPKSLIDAAEEWLASL
ncbi:MAG: 4-hydroxy-3-methylbut-2-enyl diphosphate reductase [Desulfovibrionaceae bacterium]|nr:4-hydroxy-3-methylbut-2-enyl diphosphate reductase [Desulfovibrionaceae bacterium]